MRTIFNKIVKMCVWTAINVLILILGFGGFLKKDFDAKAALDDENQQELCIKSIEGTAFVLIFSR